jgi:predicted RNA-binding protein with TRAM domain
VTEIADSLRLLFETSLERDGDRYVVPIPAALVESGGLSTAEPYRVALVSSDETTRTERSTDDPARRQLSRSAEPDANPDAEDGQGQAGVGSSEHGRQPPVDPGDVRSVTIDTLGDRGDGLARVERGFVVIVPGTEPGDRVDVEITEVRETVAFAEPVDG